MVPLKQGYLTAILFSALLLVPASALGYATAVDLLNASWRESTVTVCIANSAESYYKDLFIDAITAWSSSWSHLQYDFGEPAESVCNVTVHIVRAYAELTREGHAGVTHTRYQPGANIIESQILIPTEQELEDGSVSRVSSVSFYRIALHEFGHAIGLLHATDENQVEPIDIMSPRLAPDDMEQLISQVDIDALNRLYRVEVEYKPPEEKEIAPLPPPQTQLPQVLQEMRLNLTRAVYYTDEALQFTVEPPAVATGMQATILLYPPTGRDRIVVHKAPDPDGIIRVEVPLEGKMLGIWTIRVSYVSWKSETAFALEERNVPELPAPAPLTISASADRSAYTLGENVTIAGSVSSVAVSSLELKVRDPSGNVIAEDRIPVQPDGSFTVNLPWRMSHAPGGYTAVISHGDVATSVNYLLREYVTGVKPVQPVEIPLGQTNHGNLVMVFVSNRADDKGCPEDDWMFAYRMSNLAWIYLAQYQIPTTLQIMCQGPDDFLAYHSTGFITGYILDAGLLSLVEAGIRYDHDGIDGMALSDKAGGERFYVEAAPQSGDYQPDPEGTAWIISHELSHIALHLQGYPEDTYIDWVGSEEESCLAGSCDTEWIWASDNLVWQDTGSTTSYRVMRHYTG